MDTDSVINLSGLIIQAPLNVAEHVCIVKNLCKWKVFTQYVLTSTANATAWEVSESIVFSSAYFPIFGLNIEIYRVNNPDSDRVWKNTDQKKLQIWTLLIRTSLLQVHILQYYQLYHKFEKIVNSIRIFRQHSKPFD